MALTDSASASRVADQVPADGHGLEADKHLARQLSSLADCDADVHVVRPLHPAFDAVDCGICAAFTLPLGSKAGVAFAGVATFGADTLGAIFLASAAEPMPSACLRAAPRALAGFSPDGLPGVGNRFWSLSSNWRRHAGQPCPSARRR